MAIQKIERVSTGISSMDKLIGDGIPKGNLVLLTGHPGTGKSIFCMQFCNNAIKQKKKCVYVCIEQNVDDIKKQADMLGLNLSKVNFISAEKIRYGIGKKPDDMNEKVGLIIDECKHLKPDIIVLDSISPLEIEDGVLARLLIRKIIDGLRKIGATTLITGEALNGDYPDTVSPFLVDGVIALYYANFGPEAGRSLAIKKMRFTQHSEDVHPIKINPKGGIEIVSI